MQWTRALICDSPAARVRSEGARMMGLWVRLTMAMRWVAITPATSTHPWCGRHCHRTCGTAAPSRLWPTVAWRRFVRASGSSRRALASRSYQPGSRGLTRSCARGRGHPGIEAPRAFAFASGHPPTSMTGSASRRRPRKSAEPSRCSARAREADPGRAIAPILGRAVRSTGRTRTSRLASRQFARCLARDNGGLSTHGGLT